MKKKKVHTDCKAPGKVIYFFFYLPQRVTVRTKLNQRTGCNAWVLPLVVSLLSTWYLYWGNSQSRHQVGPGMGVTIPMGHLPAVGWGGGHMEGYNDFPIPGHDLILSFCTGPCKSGSWPVQWTVMWGKSSPTSGWVTASPSPGRKQNPP